MTSDLRLLIVTERPTLVDTIRHHFCKAGFAPSVSEVATEAAYHHCLQESFDLVIVDAALARPDPFRCLHILQQRLSVPPLIVVGDHLSPQAVAYVRQGAADFLLSHNLERIGEAFTQVQSRRRRRLPETMHAHTEEIAVLYQAAQELGSTLDPQAISGILYQIVSRFMDCTTMLVSRYLPTDNLIRCVHRRHHGQSQDVSHLPPIPLEPEGSGIQSMAIRTGESFLYNDLLSYARTSESLNCVEDEDLQEEIPDDEDVSRSALIVPLKRGDRVHGVLQIFSNRLDAYTLEHLRFLEALSPQVAATMINASLFQQAKRELAERKRVEVALAASHKRLQALADTAMVLNQTLDLDEILQRILHNVGQVVDYDGVNIMLIEDGVAKIVSCHGYYEDNSLTERLMKMRLPVHEIANLRRIVETGEPVLINDTAEDPGWESIEVAAWVRACLTVPIRYEQDVIGFLSLDAATPGFFTTIQMESLQTFADHAATALRNARLYQTLQAYSDYLEEAVAERTVELQRAVDRMEVILDNSPGGVLLLQANGRIESSNSAIRDIFGYPLSELFGQTLHLLVAPADQDKLDRLLRHTLDRGQEQRAQIVARHADGATFDVELALAPVREDGRVVSVVCNFFDISALKEVERMKDAFVSNVSHELRTPISSLKLYHGLLARRPENWDHYMVRLEREIDRLNVIIEDLLRLSRLEQGRVDLTRQTVDLNRLVEQYVVDRLPLAQRDNLILTLSPTSGLPLITADLGLLGQVLSIILTNAFAYTPAGQKISVGTRQRHGGGRHWVGFYVKDTGPGIPAGELPRIFDRFYRGTVGRNSGTAGTGLGLSIAREIITRHHGRIDVTSQTGDDSGTAFTVWLPV